MKYIFSNRLKKVVFIAFPLVTIAAILIYVGVNYQNLERRIDSIQLVVSKPMEANAFVLYISDSTDTDINFKETFFAKSVNDSVLLIDLGRKIKLRQFRLYFQQPIDNVTLAAIVRQSFRYEYRLDLGWFSNEFIQVKSVDKGSVNFTVLLGDGEAYFESPQFYYPEDYIRLLAAILIAIGLSILFYFFMREVEAYIGFNSITSEELGVLVFVLSILLPQAFFNISLGIFILVVIRNFNLKRFFNSPIDLIFIAFYFEIVLNYIWFAPSLNFSSIEKYTPLLVLPILVSCIKSTRLLICFCVSAFLIGGSVLVGASINYAIFMNAEIISNDNLTGTIHPVYYSYLLAFSIIFVEFGTTLRHKYVVHLALYFLLILSGSKLIIMALLLFSPFFYKSTIAKIAIPLVAVTLLLFAPLRDRFMSISELNDMSIISEAHIDNPNDSRLNGFTLRVILWQESMRIQNFKQLMIGRGVGESGDKALEENLRSRGLTNHLWANAHNQFVTTFFHTGLLGVTFLISILVYCFKKGVEFKDPVLVYFTIITSLAMLSESVFERVSGIVFFGLIFLLLSNRHSIESQEVKNPSQV